MTAPTTTRSVFLALLLGLGLATACFDDEALENADCEVAADCGPKQECVQTAYQFMNNSYGWCRPKGEGCAVGEQPGCECLLEGGLTSCTSTVINQALCPQEQGGLCICVLPTTIDPSLMTNQTCPDGT